MATHIGTHILFYTLIAPKHSHTGPVGDPTYAQGPHEALLAEFLVGKVTELLQNAGLCKTRFPLFLC